eukprot:sb/3466488/
MMDHIYCHTHTIYTDSKPPYKQTTNQDSSFRSRDWLSANQGLERNMEPKYKERTSIHTHTHIIQIQHTLYTHTYSSHRVTSHTILCSQIKRGRVLVGDHVQSDPDLVDKRLPSRVSLNRGPAVYIMYFAGELWFKKGRMWYVRESWDRRDRGWVREWVVVKEQQEEREREREIEREIERERERERERKRERERGREREYHAYKPDTLFRAYDVNFMVIFGIIVIKLIPLSGGPIGSLEPPEKMERSRGKTKCTKMISVLELVGVGAGIMYLSHLERSREKTEGTKMISVLELVGGGAGIMSLSHLERSRDKTKGTKMISVLELVGVGAGIKSLSHLE